MIKINLLAERKAAKANAPGGGLKLEGLSENSSISTLEVVGLVPEFSKSLVPVLGIMALVILIGPWRRRWPRN